jgi:hypothetical protein
MKKALYRLLWPLAKLYWKTFRPKTFGVKGITPNPEDDRQILLIRHSYGNRNHEIAEVAWISIDNLDQFQNIARVASYGINLYAQATLG